MLTKRSSGVAQHANYALDHTTRLGCVVFLKESWWDMDVAD